MAHFDWYQASVDCPPRVMVDALMSLPGAHDIEHGKGRLNYRESCTILSEGRDVLATVLHGGSNKLLNTVGTGENAQAVAELLRSTWPDAHRVTRLDTAQDVRTDFPTAHAALQLIASLRGIKGRSIIPDDPAEGATYYIGAATSPTQLRLYEKGKQLAKAAGTTEGFDLGAVRFEAQLRPVREGRIMAAKLTANEAWGSTEWLLTIARQHLAIAPSPVVMHRRLPTNTERSRRMFLRQYGPFILRWISDCDSPAGFGEMLSKKLSGSTSCPD